MPDTAYLNAYLFELPPSPRNVTSAALALARIDTLGWAPLRGYPGSDVNWPVACMLCDWQGVRFYSHLRRAQPPGRHSGCAPRAEFPPLLEALASTASGSCTCRVGHATTAQEFFAAAHLLLLAHNDGQQAKAVALTEHLLGPCPATARRGRAALAAFPRS